MESWVDEDLVFFEKQDPIHRHGDFEVVLQDIHEAIHGNNGFQISNVTNMEIVMT